MQCEGRMAQLQTGLEQARFDSTLAALISVVQPLHFARASLSVVDSLLNGKSKFIAELDRPRQTIQAAVAGESVLFLIDEIFAGTNSRDRRLAAEAVVRALVSRGAIGALSTHDLALSEIASPELHGVNMRTGSGDGSDPMDFDYLLKPGVTNEANALAIARMTRVPI